MTLTAAPADYVMPHAPEPTTAELEQMSDSQYKNFLYRKEGLYQPENPVPGREWGTDEFSVRDESYAEDADDDCDAGPINERMESA
jgi:hypothetical protein